MATPTDRGRSQYQRSKFPMHHNSLVCPSHTVQTSTLKQRHGAADPAGHRCQTCGRATGDGVSAAGAGVCRARVADVRRAAATGSRTTSRPADPRRRSCVDTRTTLARRPWRCACSAACTGWCSSGGLVRSAAFYPSVGGTWEPDEGATAFLALLESEPDAVREWLDRPPQTNEVGRAAALMGGLLHLPRQSPGSRATLRDRLLRWPEPPGRPVRVRRRQRPAFRAEALVGPAGAGLVGSTAGQRKTAAVRPPPRLRHRARSTSPRPKAGSP